MKQIFSLFLLLPVLISAQSIKGTFSPATDYTYAFLYSATPDGANYVDRGKLDGSGSFEIQLDSTMAPGIYKIVYAIPPEENNFDFIYDGTESVTFSFSQDSGVEFKESEENKLWDSYLKSMDMVNQAISNYYKQGKKDEVGLSSIFKVLKETQLAYEESSKGKLVATFIKANRPYIPTEYEDISTYSQNLKKHYLSELDFDNYLLQCSSFLVDRISAYVFDIVIEPNQQTYKTHVNDVVKALESSDAEIKTSLLNFLWQRFVSTDNHELANYMTDNFLLELAQSTNNNVLEQTLVAYKNTSIGATAPDFDLDIQTENGTLVSHLHQLTDNNYYLLVFWSSGCGHCLNELPKVRDLVTSNPSIKVIAFGLEDDGKDWSEEIKKYPDFIHRLGLGKWENPVAQTYGIAATPMYFLLNSSKQIIAKPYAYEDLETVLKGL